MLEILVFAAAVGQAQEAMVTLAAADGNVLVRQIASESPSGDIVLLKLPRGVAEIELSELKRRELLRAAFPGGSFALRQSGPVRVLRRTEEQAPRAIGKCFVARADIAEHSVIEEADLALSACRREAPGRWLGYETASRSVYARRDIPAGAYLGAVRVDGSAAVKAGGELLYRTSEGPVSIERKVVALQPGRSGHRIFVRTDDGTVLEAALKTEEDR